MSGSFNFANVFKFINKYKNIWCLLTKALKLIRKICYDLTMLSREAFYKQKEACKMNENKVVKFSYEQLDRLCMDAFQKFGFNAKQAAIITDVLLTADM